MPYIYTVHSETRFTVTVVRQFVRRHRKTVLRHFIEDANVEEPLPQVASSKYIYIDL